MVFKQREKDIPDASNSFTELEGATFIMPSMCQCMLGIIMSFSSVFWIDVGRAKRLVSHTLAIL
jgi:hypothetical protein